MTLPHALRVISLLSIVLFSVAVAAEPARAEPVVISERDLSAQIRDELRADPLFQGISLNVDLYHGLAIVHGGATNADMVNAINERLRDKPGVIVIFNYMSYPGQAPGVAPQSIAATFDFFGRVQRNGDNAFLLAARVLGRLRAAPGLSDYDVQVDAYRDLVILHGTVNDPYLSRRAYDVASHTPGVGAVLSYVDYSPSVAALMTAPVDVAAPVLSQPIVTPVTAYFETRIRISPCCGCP